MRLEESAIAIGEIPRLTSVPFLLPERRNAAVLSGSICAVIREDVAAVLLQTLHSGVVTLLLTPSEELPEAMV